MEEIAITMFREPGLTSSKLTGIAEGTIRPSPIAARALATRIAIKEEAIEGNMNNRLKKMQMAVPIVKTRVDPNRSPSFPVIVVKHRQMMVSMFRIHEASWDVMPSLL